MNIGLPREAMHWGIRWKWNETRRIGAILARFYVARVWQRQLAFLVSSVIKPIWALRLLSLPFFIWQGSQSFE